MHILFAASEAVPYAKTGGLADVVGELPIALTKQGIEVDIVIPLYASTWNKFQKEMTLIKTFDVYLGVAKHSVNIYTTKQGEINYFFVDNGHFFGREQFYGYGDDGERFAFFNHAVLEMISHLQLELDVIHCHDWHVGMIPVLLQEHYSNYPYYKGIKTVVTVHNPAFQGAFQPDMIVHWFGLPFELFETGKVRFQQHLNYLKSGIIYADKITAVSPTNAKELLTEEGSYGLSTVLRLREKDFQGILNGIDYNRYNPEMDAYIAAPYSVLNRQGKAINKRAFQESQHLNVDENVPLIGMVTRLTWQKGINLVIQAMERLVLMGAQVFILGAGERWYEDEIRHAKDRFPGKVASYIGYSDPLAHQLYAAADFYLMPSLFEPCGLSQMIALRYGAVPIVRQVGGLKDSVEAYNEFSRQGTGFGFWHFDADDMVRMTGYAIHFYHQKERFEEIVRQAMLVDLSWERSATQYLHVYQQLAKKEG